MSNTNICDKNQKITNFTTKITKIMESKNPLKDQLVHQVHQVVRGNQKGRP